MSRYKVQVFNWIDGELAAEDFYFMGEAQCVAFAQLQDAHSVKVYNHHGHVVHHITGEQSDQDSPY